VTLLRCNACRVIVDTGTSASRNCAACGTSLSASPPPTVWDDESPTERRPPDYFKQLQSAR
jgi:hypothetical protein